MPPRIVSERLTGIFVAGDNRCSDDSAAWPTHTAAACWNCAHTFNTPPIPIFRNYIAERDIYEVFGHACSPACAKQFILDTNMSVSQQNVTWQRQLMIDCFGWPPDKPLPCGKPWQLLKLFGGPMDIDEWRNTDDVLIVLTNQKFIPSTVVLQTHKADAAVTAVMASPSLATAASAAAVIQEAQAELTTLTGIKRPPDDRVVRTREQLQAVYPDSDLGINEPSVFLNYLRTQSLPSEEECAEMRRALEQKRKVERKRKHPLKESVLNAPAPLPMVVQQKQKKAAAEAQKNKTQETQDQEEKETKKAPSRKRVAATKKKPASPEYVPTPNSPEYTPTPNSPTYGPNSPTCGPHSLTAYSPPAAALPSPTYGPGDIEVPPPKKRRTRAR